MKAKFFGEFLIEKQVLTVGQLESVLAYQKKNNTLLGELAVRANYMTDRQVIDVLSAQEKTGEKFGKTAVQMKLLTMEQLKKLLLIQVDSHVYLGEAIIKAGLINGERVNKYLNDYSKEVRKQEIIFTQQLETIPVKDILYDIIDITVNYFSRLGVLVKADSVVVEDEMPDESLEHVFFSSQIIDKVNYHYGLIFDENSLNSIMDFLVGVNSRSLTIEEKHDNMDQIVFNINYIICKRLRKNGHKTRHRAAGSLPSKRNRIAVIKMKSIFLPFYMAYYS